MSAKEAKARLKINYLKKQVGGFFLILTASPLIFRLNLMAYKEKRTMRVYAGNDHNYKPVAQIKIQGKWLEEVGFQLATPFEIQCEDGRMVIQKLETIQ